ncbi:MAG: pentapeptide repeat-containing protein [Candidatus Zixiibacteriota bacterium]
MSPTCDYSVKSEGQVVHCNRRADDSGKCILHNPNENKDRDAFVKALIQELDPPYSKPIDLTGVVFTHLDPNFWKRSFHADVSFDRARFLSPVRFEGASFSSNCSFVFTAFQREVTFSNCYFGGEVVLKQLNAAGMPWTFRNVTFWKGFKLAAFELNGEILMYNVESYLSSLFRSLTLHGRLGIEGSTTFHGLVEFDHCILNKSISCKNVSFKQGVTMTSCEIKTQSPEFQETEFLGPTIFPNSEQMYQPPTFKSCNLQGVRIDNLPLELYQPPMMLYDCTWGTKGKKGFGQRHIVADEIDRPKSQRLIEVYRYLFKFYYDKSDFSLSSDFYIGFAIANRMIHKRNPISKFIDIFYCKFARYGESILRPLFALLIMWIIVPIVLLQIGIKIDAGSAVVVTRPIFDSTSNSLILFTGIFWKTVLMNIALSTIVRSSELRPPITSWQYFIILAETLLNGAFLAFIAVAVKRTFSPKKPF